MKDSFQLNEMELFGLNSFGGNIGIAGVQILPLIVGALWKERKGVLEEVKERENQEERKQEGMEEYKDHSVKFLSFSLSLFLLLESSLGVSQSSLTLREKDTQETLSFSLKSELN